MEKPHRGHIHLPASLRFCWRIETHPHLQRPESALRLPYFVPAALPSSEAWDADRLAASACAMAKTALGMIGS